MVRFEKLAVTHLGKDKKYSCRTSRYCSARVWVGSTCPWVDPTLPWVDSNIPWVDPLRNHRNLNFSLPSHGSTQPFFGSTQSPLGSTQLLLGSTLSVIPENQFLSVFLSCLWVDPLRVWVDSSLGRLNHCLGRPSQ